MLKNKYKDIADDLRENNIITENEYNKINNEPKKKNIKKVKIKMILNYKFIKNLKVKIFSSFGLKWL